MKTKRTKNKGCLKVRMHNETAGGPPGVNDIMNRQETRRMKKISAVLLAVLIAVCAVSAFAEMPKGDPPGEPPEGFGGGTPPGNPPGELPEGFEGGNPPGDPPGGGFGGGTPPGGGTASFEYAASTEIRETTELSGAYYSSETADESALIINTADTVTLNDITVTKTGDSDGGDNCNFYGLNAALLVMGGSTTAITGGKVETSASGANGVFCYGGNGGRNSADGDGTTLYISGTTITTTGDGSGGIMTTGGGITYAEDLQVTTSGRSSAAIPKTPRVPGRPPRR